MKNNLNEISRQVRPEKSLIRYMMQLTGWNSYDSYCRLISLAKENEIEFQEVIKKKLYREYKLNAARESLNSNSCVKMKENMLALMDKETFLESFFTSKQKESINNFRQNKISMRDLF
ncbi:hypothetical protein [Selenomonas sp. KH1T6]|uniref:hypothetical protein n=1 Tax=Selenomonas sp. KH1T6 TaxID=3158784 RepID=UPI0008A7741D|nr:hypothetical protein SAMN05216583_10462 [Selenomonas ruminantium]